MSFTGVPIAALDFYEDLEADNSKSFWTAHKAVYESAVKAPVTALAEALSPEFGPVKMFRPYRDVRFSGDKSPYKTQQGATVGGHYFHVGAAGLFVAVGYYQMSPDQLARYRAAVDADGSGRALVRVVRGLRAKDYVVGGDSLKTQPRGVAPDHPRVELLRHRALVAWRELGAPDWLSTPAAVDHIAGAWRELRPLRRWLDRHVGQAQESTRR